MDIQVILYPPASQSRSACSPNAVDDNPAWHRVRWLACPWAAAISRIAQRCYCCNYCPPKRQSLMQFSLLHSYRRCHPHCCDPRPVPWYYKSDKSVHMLSDWPETPPPQQLWAMPAGIAKRSHSTGQRTSAGQRIYLAICVFPVEQSPDSRDWSPQCQWRRSPREI